jgi:serine/threonine protein kinase/Tfp pilus assembly protein PilF
MVKECFGECLSVPPERREAFLAEQEIAEDVRSEVSRLLRNLGEANSGFLDPPDAVRRAFPNDGPLFHPGDVLADRFRILRLIGSGGMGQVYEALDTELDCSVALKALLPFGQAASQDSARFRRELLLARRVTHPNVCRLFDLNLHKFSWGGVEFLTMELLEGDTLAELIKKRGRIGQSEAGCILREMLIGLHAVHSAGIIHRDLKPGNVMVIPARADSFRVAIMDFGLALVEERQSPLTSLTATGNVLGTLAYMSPEQLAGDPVTPATDYYAFGLIWFEILTGDRPFHSDTNIANALMRLQKPVTLPSSPFVPAGWMNSIHSCLARDPAHRPSFDELLRDLESPTKRSLSNHALKGYFQVHRRDFLTGGASAVVVATVMALFWSRLRLFNQSAALPEGATALVTPVSNLTGNDSLDAVTELLRNQLTQSVHLNLLEDGELGAILRQLGKRAPASPTDLREAGWRLNAALMVFGTMSRIGNDYVLNVQLETRGSEPGNPRAKMLKSFSASDPAVLMRAVHDASLWIREAVGESARNIASFDRLPADVTTPSWEALSFYARSEQMSARQRFDDAILMLDSALQRDPQFTLAAVRRADLLMNRFRQVEGLQQWRAAIRMLDTRAITRSEELHARGMYAYDTGDFAGANKHFAAWALEYPSDPRPLIFRAVPLILDGHAGEARTILEHAAQMNHVGTSVFLQLVNSNLVLGNVEAARAWIARFRKVGDSERADLKEAAARYREHDFSGAMHLFRSLRESAVPRISAAAALHEGMLLIEADVPTKAVQRLESFLRKTSRSEEDPERAILWTVLGWAQYRSGRPEGAVGAVSEALNLQRGYVVLVNAGTILARSGALDQAQQLVNQCTAFQDMPAYRITSLRIRGEMERRRGHHAEALNILRKASSLEPRLANREYLIDALRPEDPERVDLSRKVVASPWPFFRDLTIDSPGVLATAVRSLLRSNPQNGDALSLSRSLRDVANLTFTDK